MFIIDAHLDLAMNAMEWNRDLRLPLDEIRKGETGMNDKPDREKGTVSFDELRRGNIGLVVATQIARYVAPGSHFRFAAPRPGIAYGPMRSRHPGSLPRRPRGPLVGRPGARQV